MSNALTVEQKAARFAEIVAKHVTEIHELDGSAPGRWSAIAGQWIVYGLETQIGFFRGVDLCAVVERAWRAKQPIGPAIEALYLTWVKK